MRRRFGTPAEERCFLKSSYKPEIETSYFLEETNVDIIEYLFMK